MCQVMDGTPSDPWPRAGADSGGGRGGKCAFPVCSPAHKSHRCDVTSRSYFSWSLPSPRIVSKYFFLKCEFLGKNMVGEGGQIGRYFLCSNIEGLLQILLQMPFPSCQPTALGELTLSLTKPRPAREISASWPWSSGCHVRDHVRVHTYRVSCIPLGWRMRDGGRKWPRLLIKPRPRGPSQGRLSWSAAPKMCSSCLPKQEGQGTSSTSTSPCSPSLPWQPTVASKGTNHFTAGQGTLGAKISVHQGVVSWETDLALQPPNPDLSWCGFTGNVHRRPGLLEKWPPLPWAQFAPPW